MSQNVEPTAEMRPTKVRFLIILVMAITAIFMYVDRACLSQLKGDIATDLKLSDAQMDWVLSAFFWAYALAQVPAGALGPKFGMRKSLAICLFIWSVFTATSGLAMGFLALIASRLAVGLSEAAAYPTAAGLVRGWYPQATRGRANSVVTLGGRFGWALSQLITPVLLTFFISYNLSGWRSVLILYGVMGVLMSFVFYWLVRDSARQHPWSNEAEANMVPQYALMGQPGYSLPWKKLATTRILWFSGGTQFCINLAWIFLLTNLPKFLTERFGVSNEERGVMASIPAFVSCFGMFAGGIITDALSRRLGLRWARSLPIGMMTFFSALAYLSCIWIQNPWMLVIALSFMAIGVDLGVPSLWAFAQDVGGRHTGAVLGWGNMWGNIGAALSPVILGLIQRAYGWDAVFVTCAIAFVCAGCFGLTLDARKQMDQS